MAFATITITGRVRRMVNVSAAQRDCKHAHTKVSQDDEARRVENCRACKVEIITNKPGATEALE